MREDFLIRNFPKSSILMQEFDVQKEKILRIFKKLENKDILRISCHMEKNPHKEQYLTGLNFYLPGKVFNVTSGANDALASLKYAFSRLSTRVKKYKEHIYAKRRGVKAT